MDFLLLENSDLQNEIRNTIDAIAAKVNSNSDSMPGLMDGQAGQILFLAYYSRYKADSTYNQKIVGILSDIFDKIHNGYRLSNFAGGLAGIGWTVEHLAQNDFITADINLIIGELDDFLYPDMLKNLGQGNFDYLHGAIGIGLYYLNRRASPKTSKYLERLVDELENISIQYAGTISWIKYSSNNHHVKGIDLGLAHGIPSIIVFLSRLYRAGIHSERNAALISGAVQYLLENSCNLTGSYYHFPACISDSIPKPEIAKSGRLAWCYYDLGIGIAIWQAGHILNNDSWKQVAITVLLDTTKIIASKETGIMDAGFCHGTVGIAHIFNRMYNYTKIEAFKTASIFWFDQTLKMAKFTDGLLGYKTFHLAEYGGYQNDYSLLTGISGIGLSMISAVSNIEPNWDRALLLS